MKKTLLAIILALAVVAIPLAGCGIASGGPVSTRTYDIKDFTGVVVGSAFKVEITRADTFSVSVTANENLFDHLEIVKSGSTLRIRTRSVSFSFNPTLEAKVTMPALDSLEVSGASRVTASGFKSSSDFRLEVSGASTVDFGLETGVFTANLSGASRTQGELKASDARIEVSGASRITLTGTGKDLALTASGASQATLSGFTVGDCAANISGASRASIAMNGTLDVTLSGASTLEYSGSPTLGKTSVTGASTLRRAS